MAQENLSHDATGNLKSVTHTASAGSTTMQYDLLGRKTEMNDPDLGLWTYAYDRQSHITRQTDARGKTTCLYYEWTLFRLVAKHFRTDTSCPAHTSNYSNGTPILANNATLDVLNRYDENHSSSNRSRGQLTNTNNSDLLQSFSYNSQGQLAFDNTSLPWSMNVAYT